MTAAILPKSFIPTVLVVHLITEMLKPQSGESIYDPTCGSAGMLISSIAYLKQQGLEWRNVKIYGQEINALTSAIGRMNLFLHGVKDFNIVNDDVLKNPAFIENGKLKQFNLVLANPPYLLSSGIAKLFLRQVRTQFPWNTATRPSRLCVFSTYIKKSRS